MKIKQGQEEAYAKYVATNSRDPYSLAVVTYAERWANLMEKLITKGANIINIAEKTSYTADTDGITGFMYGCAVQGLATFWEHGELLRKWHNKEYGVENSEGVVNPAIINIKS